MRKSILSLLPVILTVILASCAKTGTDTVPSDPDLKYLLVSEIESYATGVEIDNPDEEHFIGWISLTVNTSAQKRLRSYETASLADKSPSLLTPMVLINGTDQYSLCFISPYSSLLCNKGYSYGSGGGTIFFSEKSDWLAAQAFLGQ